MVRLAIAANDRSFSLTESPPGFQRGWTAALLAVQAWHEAKAKQTLVLARRSRFPKNHEREAEWHRQCGELILTLSPDDV